MSNGVKIKNIFFALIFCLTIIVCVDFLLKPYEYFNLGFLNKFLEKTRQVQEIAPQRLYVNAHRLAKQEYVDNSMNGQDWNRWRFRYSSQIKTLEDANVAINTMLASLNDPYTKFLQSKSFAEQKIILDSKITGVGLMFNKAGDEIVVNHVLKNSSAQSQHIMAGDSIVSINGVKTKGMSQEQIHSLIETSKNKNIKFEIKRGDEVLVKDLKRTEISIDTMKYRLTKDNIAIITLANIMGANAVIDFRNIIEKTNNTKGIILDLRNNYGGILANAVIMADFMLKDRKIVSINSKGKPKYEIYADDEVIFIEKPIVILVNERTASAAEILAGTLKDNAGAILIGDRTYGKNSIQQIIPMTNASGLMITSSKYILPEGEDIHDVGIEPNYYVQDNNSMKEAIKLINQVVKKEK